MARQKELTHDELVAQKAVMEYRIATGQYANLREALRTAMRKEDEDSTALYRRSSEDMDDPFAGLYGRYLLKEPPYPFQNLWSIFEESDILQSCVDAYQKNVDGFGYQLMFLGDDIKDRKLPANKAEETKAKNFFDRVNEDQSFATVRQLMRQDIEVIGNGGLEVIRNVKEEVTMLYHVPFQYVRLSSLDGVPVVKVVHIPRNGKVVPIRIRKHYRRFAQVRSDGKTLRWFREFGDPRPMDSTTGEYGKVGEKIKNPASEIWHFKIPFGGLAYGLPRWIGAILSVMGRRLADYVNYDLFENQGVPPMAVLISGGTLTDESMKTLREMIQGLRGTGNFNRIWVLEALVEAIGIDDRGTAKMELKNLTEFRKEDLMFAKYMENSEKMVRHRYRLPPLYVGAAETFTHATAKAAQTVAEEQVFVPERFLFDERVTNQLLSAELLVTKFLFKSKGPRVVGAADISTALDSFTRSGAFTVNHAIDRANEAFGLEMSRIDQPWADYPTPMVLELIRNGQIMAGDLIEGMTNREPEPPKALPAPAQQQKLLPAPEVKKAALDRALKSDLFTKDEKTVLRILYTIGEKLGSLQSLAEME